LEVELAFEDVPAEPCVPALETRVDGTTELRALEQ
jgi:hypothetical protein